MTWRDASIRAMPPDPAMPAVHVDWLPYTSRLVARPVAEIDLVVIHCTELPDLAMARRFGEEVRYVDSQTGNSGHYYVERDGALHQYVPLDRIAHHTRGYNARSVGIELVNTGRYPDWLDSRHQAMDEPYTQAQVEALVALLRQLQRELPNLRFIAGHEDVDTDEVAATDNPHIKVRRKRDPGPLFPWAPVLDEVGLERL
jgi:N-acetylmuramoyl-L-alanine amidase